MLFVFILAYNTVDHCCTNVDYYSGKAFSMEQGAKHKTFRRQQLHILL